SNTGFLENQFLTLKSMYDLVFRMGKGQQK
ncbi:MAG: hypothetical protein RLZZ69_1234, partial [Cyanobacteriota bacterium]